MKKNNILFITGIVFLSLWITTKANAQLSSTYVYVEPMYTFSANSTKINENISTPKNSGITFTQGVYGSFGHGFCVQGGIGKMFSSTLGIEMAAEWANSKRIKTTYQDEDYEAGELSEGVTAVTLKPMLVLRNSGDLLSIYSKLGLAIVVYSRHIENEDYHYTINNQNFHDVTTAVEDIKPKVGFTASFGLSFRISQSMAITTELTGQMVSLPIYKGHYTKFTENGKDILPTMSTHDKEWVYEKSISSDPGDPNKPQVFLYEPANFSYIGIAIGLKYYL